MTKKILFEELKPDELKQMIEESGIIYFPLGTLEWHRDHLPFGTDAFESYELCKEACKITNGCVIPPLYFGTDREHEVDGKILHGMDARVGRILPGSIYFLKPELFYKVIESVAENVDQQGFKKIVIISSHAGKAQRDALEKLGKKKISNLKILFLSGKDFAGGINHADKGIHHADKLETNLMLAIKPELVEMEKIKKPYEALHGDDPSLAKKKDGEEHFKKIVEQIVEMVKNS